MEELIFIAVIIFFSIIESIARSRKKKAGGELPPQPEEWTRAQRGPPSYDTPPSYDEDPSFDAAPSREESSAREEPRRARSSESMIPGDIWQEIERLAKESPPARRVPAPQPPRRAPLPPATRAPTPRPTPPTKPAPPAKRRPAAPASPKRGTILAPEPAPQGARAHVVHASHADYGSDPSQRARSAEDGLDPLARALSQDIAAVRRQLRGQGSHALRQAMILQEVLGPPVGSRSDRSED